MPNLIRLSYAKFVPTFTRMLNHHYVFPYVFGTYINVFITKTRTKMFWSGINIYHWTGRLYSWIWWLQLGVISYRPILLSGLFIIHLLSLLFTMVTSYCLLDNTYNLCMDGILELQFHLNFVFWIKINQEMALDLYSIWIKHVKWTGSRLIWHLHYP